MTERFPRAWFVQNKKTGQKIYLKEGETLQIFLETRIGEDILDWCLCVVPLQAPRKVESGLNSIKVVESKRYV